MGISQVTMLRIYPEVQIFIYLNSIYFEWEKLGLHLRNMRVSLSVES